MPRLTFTRRSRTINDTATLDADELILAGWTGRDQADVQHHIDELAALGIPGPSRTPIYYRTSVDHVSQTERLQVLGPDTSGEIEYVLLSFPDGLWFTVGSDQTDRKAETMGIALSKQLAGKVFAREAWRLDEHLPHWDALRLTAHATIDGKKVVYQDTAMSAIRPPLQLIELYTGGKKTLPVGTIMMSGTPPAIGGIRPAARFDMTLADPASGASISHGYEINVLPVVS